MAAVEVEEVTRAEAAVDISVVEGIHRVHLTRQRPCMFTAHRPFMRLRVRRSERAPFNVPRLAQDFLAAAAADCPQG